MSTYFAFPGNNYPQESPRCIRTDRTNHFPAETTEAALKLRYSHVNCYQRDTNSEMHPSGKNKASEQARR